MTHEQLVEGIRKGGREREIALRFIYQSDAFRNPVKAYVLANGGTMDDFKDNMQNTLIAFERNIRLGVFKGESAPTTYFVQIARWRWQAYRRTLRPTEAFEATAEKDAPALPLVQQVLDNEDMRTLLDKALDVLGSPCKEMLQLYALSYSMEEIATGYEDMTADQAKRKMHGCREKMKNEILANADLKKRCAEIFASILNNN